MPSLADFPEALPEPDDYLQGMDAPLRPQSRNMIVFMRRNRTNLQQMHFQNRSHHRHVLLLVLDTPGTVIVDGIKTRLGLGQGLLILPFQFHHYIDLDEDSLRWLFITFELGDASAALDAFSHRVLQPNADALKVWIEIADTWRNESRATRVELLPLLDRLLMKLMRSGFLAQESPGNASSRGSWIARAEALLRQAVDERWTLDEVARRSGLSERHFRTRFEAECGTTIREYRANYQLHCALALMRGSNVSFGEIAERIGFQSSAAFCRFIRRETNMTPMQLKRSL